jgi:pimeloyl-ACP methyl ester carboxylesterase
VATLVTEQGIIHYEAYGRGRPVLLLHGWLNSWAIWRPTIELLGNEFRFYALDFLGFGDSDERASVPSVDNFTLMVNQFFDRLGIQKAPLMGHSMGGTVSLKVALANPEKVVKVIVVGSPIQGSSLRPLLKLAAYPGWVSLSKTAPGVYTVFQHGFMQFLRGYSYFMAKDGKQVAAMLKSDVSKLTAAPFFQSIGTLRQTDLRQSIGALPMPVLGIYGKKDIIVHPNQGDALKQALPASKIAWFDQSGHFPMMDESDKFHQTVRDFLYNS